MANANVRLGINGVNRSAGAFASARKSMKSLRHEQFAMGRQMKHNRRVVQQAGMQISDFAVQVGGGQSAILAFTQNAPQFVQSFGALGGALAAVITIGGVFALMMSRAGVSVDDFADSFGALSEPIRAVGKGLNIAKEALFDFLNFTVNNLDMLLSTMSVIAALLIGKWVLSLKLGSASLGILAVHARAAALSISLIGPGATSAMIAMTLLNKAIIVFRKILMTLGIPALIIGLGYLVERFLTLKKGAGSFGEALVLLKNVAVEVWGRLADGTWVIALRMQQTVASMQSAWASALAWMQGEWATFLHNVADATYKIPGMTVFAKNLKDSAIMAGSAVYDLEHLATVYAETAAGLSVQAEEAAGKMLKPLESLAALRAALKKGDVGKQFDIRDMFGGGDDGEGGGDAITTRLKSMKKMVEELATSIGDSMGDAFMSMVDGTKSAADAFRGMAREIIKELYKVLVVERLVGSIKGFLGGEVGSGGGFLGGLLKPFGTRAGGGVVSAGQPYLVGERGPEVMVPNRSGAVIPNGRGGGQVINLTYQFQGGVTQADLANAMPRLVESTKRAVIDATQRGGAIASVMRG